MLSIDCHELTFDEQLALAGAMTSGLAGKAVALVKDEEVVLDTISGNVPTFSEVESIVRMFVARRNDRDHYSVETEGNKIVVRSPDPLARSRGRKDSGQVLPDNLLKCPFSGCGFVTPFQEVMINHVRMH